MLIDRTHRSWAMISTVILALGIVSYLVYAGAGDKGATGGSLPGLIYGVIGTAMMVFAGLLAARKKVSHWRLGSAQFWLRGHLWLGGLSFPFILFHSGFAFGGVLEQILMWIFVAVWLSGFYGLAMQHLLPQLLTSRVERETFLAQVPYIRRRNRIMSDRMVFEQCGQIPLTNDPMKAELERLVRHGKKVRDLEAAGKKDEAREEKTKWADHVDDFDLALFRDIATISKTNGWIRTVNDLTPYFVDIYSVKGVSDLKETAADETAGKKGGGSPLDAIKAGGAKKPGGSPLDAIKAGGAKKPGGSPLDAIKAAGAKKPGGSPLDAIKAAGAKKAGGSPLDAIKAAGAKKPGGSPLDAIKAAGAKKPGGSPLDAIKAAGAKKPGGSPLDAIKAAGAKKPGGSPLDAIKAAGAKKPGGSPLDAIRAGGAKKPAGAAKPGGSPLDKIRAASGNKPAGSPLDQIRAGKGSEKPVASASSLSPIEQIRASSKGASASSAAPSAAAPSAVVSSSAVPKAVPAAVKSRKPVPIPKFVPNVAGEVSSIEKLLVEKYGYDSNLAGEVAESARPFLKRDDEDPDKAVATITSLLVEKYGYEAALAEEVAELARPFLGVTAEELSAAAAPTASASAAPTSSKPVIAKIQAKAAAGGAKPLVAKKEPVAEKETAGAKASVKKAPAPKAIVPKKKAAAKVPILRTKELREFYLDEVRPYMAANPRTGRLASVRESNRAFNQMRGTLPVELHEILSALQARCDEHRQFASQERIHHWLHYWLILHIPFSMVLYVLMIVHIVMALRVVPFTFSLFGG